MKINNVAIINTIDLTAFDSAVGGTVLAETIAEEAREERNLELRIASAADKLGKKISRARRVALNRELAVKASRENKAAAGDAFTTLDATVGRKAARIGCAIIAATGCDVEVAFAVMAEARDGDGLAEMLDGDLHDAARRCATFGDEDVILDILETLRDNRARKLGRVSSESGHANVRKLDAKVVQDGGPAVSVIRRPDCAFHDAIRAAGGDPSVDMVVADTSRDDEDFTAEYAAVTLAEDGWKDKEGSHYKYALHGRNSGEKDGCAVMLSESAAARAALNYIDAGTRRGETEPANKWFGTRGLALSPSVMFSAFGLNVWPDEIAVIREEVVNITTDIFVDKTGTAAYEKRQVPVSRHDGQAILALTEEEFSKAKNLGFANGALRHDTKPFKGSFVAVRRDRMVEILKSGDMSNIIAGQRDPERIRLVICESVFKSWKEYEASSKEEAFAQWANFVRKHGGNFRLGLKEHEPKKADVPTQVLSALFAADLTKVAASEWATVAPKALPENFADLFVGEERRLLKAIPEARSLTVFSLTGEEAYAELRRTAHVKLHGEAENRLLACDVLEMLYWATGKSVSALGSGVIDVPDDKTGECVIWRNPVVAEVPVMEIIHHKALEDLVFPCHTVFCGDIRTLYVLRADVDGDHIGVSRNYSLRCAAKRHNEVMGLPVIGWEPPEGGNYQNAEDYFANLRGSYELGVASNVLYKYEATIDPRDICSTKNHENEHDVRNIMLKIAHLEWRINVLVDANKHGKANVKALGWVEAFRRSKCWPMYMQYVDNKRNGEFVELSDEMDKFAACADAMPEHLVAPKAMPRFVATSVTGTNHKVIKDLVENDEGKLVKRPIVEYGTFFSNLVFRRKAVLAAARNDSELNESVVAQMERDTLAEELDALCRHYLTDEYTIDDLMYSLVAGAFYPTSKWQDMTYLTDNEFGNAEHRQGAAILYQKEVIRLCGDWMLRNYSEKKLNKLLGK